MIVKHSLPAIDETMNGYVIYARKSSESSERQTQSLPDQKKILLDLAKKRGLKVVKVFTESKSAMQPGRPLFNEMLKLIEEGKADGICAWDLSRLTRNMTDLAALDRLFTSDKLKKIITPRTDYTSDGFIQFAIEATLNTEYSRSLSRAVKRSVTSRIERGVAPHPPLPGYLMVGLKGQKEHTPDKVMFPLMRDCFNSYLTGDYSVSEIWEYAKSLGLTNYRGKIVSRTQMYALLRHPFYTGTFVAKGKEYPGTHEEMITKQEHKKILEIMQGKSHPKKEKHDFVFNNLMNCGECGRAIYGEQHIKKSGKVYRYYRCSKRGTNCKQPYAPENKLERQLQSYLSALRPSRQFSEYATNFLKKALPIHEKSNDASRVALQNRLNSIETKLKNAKAKLLDEEIPELPYSEIREMVRELKLDRDEVIENIKGVVKKDNKFTDLAIDCISFARQAEQLFNSKDKLKRRAVMKLVGTRYELLNGSVQVKPRGVFQIIKNPPNVAFGQKGRYEPQGVVVFLANSEGEGTLESSLRVWPNAIRTSIENLNGDDLTNMEIFLGSLEQTDYEHQYA